MAVTEHERLTDGAPIPSGDFYQFRETTISRGEKHDLLERLRVADNLLIDCQDRTVGRHPIHMDVLAVRRDLNALINAVAGIYSS